MITRLASSLSLLALPKMFLQEERLDGVRSDLNPNQLLSLSFLEKPEYTSLRDVIMASPTNSCHSRLKDLEWCDLSDIAFKDKLLKQAAKAYLQPFGTTRPAPKTTMHVLNDYWTYFNQKNKLLISSVRDYVENQLNVCFKFLRTQTFSFIEDFKFPRYIEYQAPR